MTNTAQNLPIVPVDSSYPALVNVFEGEIGGVKQPVVDARELHVYLQNQRQFADWIKIRITKYNFIADQDFVCFSQKSETQRRDGQTGAARSTEYHLTLDTAKELSMVENNEQGRTARRYFIDCERRATEALIQSLTSYAPRHKIIPEQKSVLKEIVDQRTSGNVGARAEMWSRHNRHFNINSYHELLAIHFEDAKRYLNSMVLKTKVQPEQELLPTPFMTLPMQTGRFLVECDADGTTTIYDANNHELVEKGLMEKFHRDWEVAANAIMQMYTTSFAKVGYRIHEQNNQLPVLKKFIQSN